MQFNEVNFLSECIKEAWDVISSETLDALVNSMQKRCKAVVFVTGKKMDNWGVLLWFYLLTLKEFTEVYLRILHWRFCFRVDILRTVFSSPIVFSDILQTNTCQMNSITCHVCFKIGPIGTKKSESPMVFATTVPDSKRRCTHRLLEIIRWGSADNFFCHSPCRSVEANAPRSIDFETHVDRNGGTQLWSELLETSICPLSRIICGGLKDGSLALKLDETTE